MKGEGGFLISLGGGGRQKRGQLTFYSIFSWGGVCWLLLSAKLRKLEINFLYIFELDQFLTIITALIYYASAISLVNLNKVFRSSIRLYESLAQKVRFEKPVPNRLIICIVYLL